MVGTTDSLITLLRADHEAIEKILGRFDQAGAAGRAEAFCEFTHNLIGHEVAEEAVVYPIVRRHVDGGDNLADKRIAEQAKVEEALSKLERLDATTDHFRDGFRTLQPDVLTHAKAEEETVFPELAAVIDGEELENLGKLYLAARGLAPTHPHPHMPDTPPANLVMGPVASLVDHVRDAVRGVLTSKGS